MVTFIGFPFSDLEGLLLLPPVLDLALVVLEQPLHTVVLVLQVKAAACHARLLQGTGRGGNRRGDGIDISKACFRET